MSISERMPRPFERGVDTPFLVQCDATRHAATGSSSERSGGESTLVSQGVRSKVSKSGRLLSRSQLAHANAGTDAHLGPRSHTTRRRAHAPALRSLHARPRAPALAPLGRGVRKQTHTRVTRLGHARPLSLCRSCARNLEAVCVGIYKRAVHGRAHMVALSGRRPPQQRPPLAPPP